MKAVLCCLLLLAGTTVMAASDPLAEALDAVRAGRAAEAAAIYRRLAQGGDARAQFNLGLLYLDGRGVPQSHAEALYWAWRARLSGQREAPALLDRLSPVATPDLRETLTARIAADLMPEAEAGDGRAMLELAGVLIELAPEPDLTGGFVWQAIAAALEVPGAVEAREATGMLLDAKARLEAEAQVFVVLQGLCGKGLKGRALCSAVLPEGEQAQGEAH